MSVTKKPLRIPEYPARCIECGFRSMYLRVSGKCETCELSTPGWIARHPNHSVEERPDFRWLRCLDPACAGAGYIKELFWNRP